MKEINLQQLIRLRASELGAVMWRNNTGAYKDQNGRLVTYGLCKGSADLIGLYKGRFVALEIKRPNKKPTPEQVLFLEVVRKNGGIAAVITSPDDLEAVLNSQ